MDGKEIRRRRQAAGLSVDQFAKAVGVGRRTVTNWETGSTGSDRYTGRIEHVLSANPQRPPLSEYDDIQLLSELITRAAQRTKRAPVAALRSVPDRPDFPDDQLLAARDEPPQGTGHDQR